MQSFGFAREKYGGSNMNVDATIYSRLYFQKVVDQKINYIHANPVQPKWKSDKFRFLENYMEVIEYFVVGDPKSLRELSYIISISISQTFLEH